MDGFGFLISAAAIVLALIAMNKLAKVETKLAQLKIELGNLGAEFAKLRVAGPAAAPAEARSGVIGFDERGAPVYEDSAAERVAYARADMAAEAALPAPSDGATPAAELQSAAWTGVAGAEAPADQAEAAAPPAEPQKPRDMEQALASRWFVWIGGIAIAIGGLLFVKYAYDNGLVSPTLQIILGLMIGLGLVDAGEWVRRKALTAAQRPTSYVPAALSAAGLATVFASIYAAYALYQLISPTPAFFGLALTGLGALALSRWQGPLIAALGLIGSYVTPAMIPSAEPSAWTFFPYLLVILASSFLTLRGRNWWWLGYAAIAGGFVWSALWINLGMTKPGEVWPVGLFAHLLGLVALFGIEGRAILREESGSLLASRAIRQPLLIGFFGLAAETVLLCFLVSEMHHATPAVALLFAAMLIVTAVAWIKHGLSPLAPVAGLVMFAALMVWEEAAFHALAFDEQGIWTWSNSFGTATALFLRWMVLAGGVFTFIGVAHVILKPKPLSFGILAAVSAFLFVWGAWARADFLLSETTWALLAGVFAAVLLAGAWQAARRSDEAEVDIAAGLLAASAAALLVLALDRLLDRIWLTLAIAFLALAYAFAARILKPRLMGPITAALATLTTFRLFASRELWFDDRSLPMGQHWVIYGYGIPSVLFYVSSKFLRQSGHLRSAVALEGISLGLVISLVSLELRVLIGGSVVYENPEFLEMAAHVLTWLGAAYGLMHRQRLFSSLIAMWGARALIAAAVLAIAVFSLVLYNPVFTEEPVAGNIVFNSLLLAYLMPAILIGLIAFRLDVIGWPDLKPAAGALSLLLTFVYITEETKRVFQGKIMMVEPLSIAESYAYSAVWLVFALALFVAGISLHRKYLRLAGLGVMALVVLKVFAWDMSGLEGLYRIASFIGLGLCLVGIGWLYQRFVQPPRTAAAS
jgi:uncharacterized membrane protein